MLSTSRAGRSPAMLRRLRSLRRALPLAGASLKRVQESTAELVTRSRDAAASDAAGGDDAALASSPSPSRSTMAMSPTLGRFVTAAKDMYDNKDRIKEFGGILKSIKEKKFGTGDALGAMGSILARNRSESDKDFLDKTVDGLSDIGGKLNTLSTIANVGSKFLPAALGGGAGGAAAGASTMLASGGAITGAAVAGMQIGMAFDDEVKRTCSEGRNKFGECRSRSDASADRGIATADRVRRATGSKALGDVLGIANVLGDSALATGEAILATPGMLVRGTKKIVDDIFGFNQPYTSLTPGRSQKEAAADQDKYEAGRRETMRIVRERDDRAKEARGEFVPKLTIPNLAGLSPEMVKFEKGRATAAVEQQYREWMAKKKAI